MMHGAADLPLRIRTPNEFKSIGPITAVDILMPAEKHIGDI